MTHARPRPLAGLAPAGLLLTGCDDQPAVPTTVIVNTPPADAGLSVLLTVMIVAAFLGLIAAGVAGWGWACERRARLDAERAQRLAEDVVLALSGKPVEQAWAAIADRDHYVARPARAVQRRPE
jgi:hypothetical protein